MLFEIKPVCQKLVKYLVFFSDLLWSDCSHKSWGKNWGLHVTALNLQTIVYKFLSRINQTQLLYSQIQFLRTRFTLSFSYSLAASLCFLSCTSRVRFLQLSCLKSSTETREILCSQTPNVLFITIKQSIQILILSSTSVLDCSVMLFYLFYFILLASPNNKYIILTTFINGGYFSILLSVFKFAWLTSFGLKYSFEFFTQRRRQPCKFEYRENNIKIAAIMKVVYLRVSYWMWVVFLHIHSRPGNIMNEKSE